MLYSAFHPDLPQQIFEFQLKDNQNLSDDNFFIEKNSFSPPIAQSSFSGNLYHGESINSYPAPLSDKYGDSPIKSLPRSDSFRPNKNSNESLRESQPTIRNKVSKNNIKSSISVDSFMSDIKKRELSEVSDLSFEILRSPPKELSLALLKGNHLQHEAIKIVTQANPNRLALYRVAHLTFYALIEKS
ncbi:hypothetical protein TRFO_12065 [Tritrichomonas foetus]|uniref:Uncharacterized protein n=1 Tax=Tritrichomonas foetus TaxID=1144522 RepID=A0A1J4J4H2_9EUKA|nr:hypothetical protein TRFO_12065 [Tritrichomonas foetus]|eukprot:OHS93055.1 hypothetical protein TRFO_12065 [Tritrichomonas foetus]